MNKAFKAFGTVVALAIASPAFAQSWYIGAAGGSSKGDIDTGRIDNDLRDLGFFTASTSKDDSDTSWRLFGGYRVLPWLDVEAHYADFGTLRFDSTVTPGGMLSARIRTKAYGVAAVAGVTPMDRLRLYAKGGVARTEAKASFASTGFVDLASDSLTKRKTGAVYGVGLQYDFTRMIAARVEYDVHTKVGSDVTGGEFDVKTASVGVLLRF